MSQTVPPVLNDVADTMRTNFVGFASFTILVWDHVITFSDEVEYIWKGKKKGPIIYLFIFNRYFTPLGFIINLFAYLSPTWTIERFVISVLAPHQSPEASNLPVVGAMMLLRINALYPTQRWITVLLGLMLVVETGVNAWLISRGEPVLHNQASGVHACSMIFDPAISHAASASAWYPLLYDSIVFALTVNRTLPSIRKKQAGFIVKRLLEDGVLYYSVIFSITFVLTFMIVAAPPGTKNICAQMEQLITVAMMSRITLSLKKAGRHGEIVPTPFLFDGRNAEFYSDTFMSMDSPPEDVTPPHTDGLKHPDRLVLHGRSAIQFAIPPSPQPSFMLEPFASSAKAVRASTIHDA
ncbi:hypothetical protein C8R45DRAFT_1172842 [Mycena sanguinolenta]|nr:hypothetical protein C8R45DRAFT_1172842 [Mycena sanguinolenta]